MELKGIECDLYREPRENRERFIRQKREMETLVRFLEKNTERQQEYKDRLERMERKGMSEEEIVW
jgi:hypothetical protein